MKQTCKKHTKTAIQLLLAVIAVCLVAAGLMSCQPPTPTDTPDTNTYNVTFTGVYDNYEFYSESISYKVDDKQTFSPREVVGYTFDNFDESVTVTTDNKIELTKLLDKKEIKVNYKPQFLTMPIVWIDTENGAAIVDKENYVNCDVSIKNTQDSFLMDRVSAGIRGRGNSTWTAGTDKKPFRIKFDKKQSVLGSEYKAKSWTLLANFYDRSLSRNALAYTLADELDDVAFSSARNFVELYLNGEYMGVYLLCDQMQTGAGRVDVDETFAEDGDTGYLLEMSAAEMYEGTGGTYGNDVFKINSYVYEIKTPDADSELYNPDVYLNYIKSYIEKCMAALNGQYYAVVADLMDIQSFADAYIVHELFANVDVGWSSFYLYKDKGGKLCCGPLWDFDISSGNMNYGPGNEQNCPSTGYLCATNYWYRSLLKFDEFTNLIKTKLIKYEKTIRNVINLVKTDNTDGYYLQYGECFNRNFIKDNVLGKKHWPLPNDVASFATVEEHLTYLYNWLNERCDYLFSYYCDVVD